MKTIRLFLYFVIGLFLGSWGVLAFAETTPVIKTAKYRTLNVNYDTPDLAGQAYCAFKNASFVSVNPQGGTPPDSYGVTCQYSWGSVRDSSVIDLKYIYSCPDSSWSFYYGGAGVPQYCERPDCPPGKERHPLTGQCVDLCIAPEVRDPETGICAPPKDCIPLAGKSQPGITGLNFSGNGSMPSELCFDGCAYSTDFAVGLTGPGGSAMWGARAGKPTGNLCSPGSGEPTLDCPSGEVPTADGKGCESNCFQCVETPAGKCVKSTVCSARSGTFSQISQTCGPSCADQQKEGDKECGPDGVLIGRSHGQPVCLKSAPKDESCTSRGGTVVGTVDGKPICNLPDSPATCPDGTPSQGTVNGTPVCRGVCPPGMLLTDSADGGQSCKTFSPVTDKKTDMKPDAKPEGTKVNGVPVGDKSKSTVCQGDNCTTTEVERDGNGNIIGTKETTGAKSDFCEKNPTSPLCSGQTEGDKFCKDNPDSIQCMKAGEVGEEGALTESSRGVQSITATPLTTNATCPAPIALPVGEITWTPICNAAEWLKPLILAFAWLSAGLIVIGGIKTEG